MSTTQLILTFTLAMASPRNAYMMILKQSYLSLVKMETLEVSNSQSETSKTSSDQLKRSVFAQTSNKPNLIAQALLTMTVKHALECHCTTDSVLLKNRLSTDGFLMTLSQEILFLAGASLKLKTFQLCLKISVMLSLSGSLTCSEEIVSSLCVH
jgi:hypothetical protein